MILRTLFTLHTAQNHMRSYYIHVYTTTIIIDDDDDDDDENEGHQQRMNSLSFKHFKHIYLGTLSRDPL